MAAITVSDAEREELEKIGEENQELCELVKATVIDSEETFGEVTKILKEVKQQNKELEERKQRVTKPLLAVVEEVRSWFRPAQSWLTAAEMHLKTMLADYRREVDAKNMEAMRLLAATQGQADVSFVAQPKAQGLSMSEAWDWEIEDEALVPREYLCVDDKKVKAYLKLSPKGATPAAIPGLKFVQKMRVMVRA